MSGGGEVGFDFRHHIAVNDLTDQSQLEAFASNPELTLDVTKLDLARLPARVKAALWYYDDAPFNAPQLQTSGDIVALSATSFSAPQLQESRDILAPRATSFNAPLLQESGDIHVFDATSFSAPQLQKSGEICAYHADSFSAPLLRKSGDIYADDAESFNAPQLQESGYIRVGSEFSFSAPQLRRSGSIDVPFARSFAAPQLQESGDIRAPMVTSFKVPQLQKSGDLSFGRIFRADFGASEWNFSAPQLRRSGNIDVRCEEFQRAAASGIGGHLGPERDNFQRAAASEIWNHPCPQCSRSIRAMDSKSTPLVSCAGFYKRRCQQKTLHPSLENRLFSDIQPLWSSLVAEIRSSLVVFTSALRRPSVAEAAQAWRLQLAYPRTRALRTLGLSPCAPGSCGTQRRTYSK